MCQCYRIDNIKIIFCSYPPSLGTRYLIRFHTIYRGILRLDRKLECSSKIYGVILFLCSIVLAVSAQKINPDIVQYDHEIKQKAGVLDSIKEELKKGRRKLVELQTQEGSVQERIDQLEKNIISSKTYLGLLSRKIDSLEAQITILKDSVTVAGKKAP